MDTKKDRPSDRGLAQVYLFLIDRQKRLAALKPNTDSPIPESVRSSENNNEQSEHKDSAAELAD